MKILSATHSGLCGCPDCRSEHGYPHVNPPEPVRYLGHIGKRRGQRILKAILTACVPPRPPVEPWTSQDLIHAVRKLKGEE